MSRTLPDLFADRRPAPGAAFLHEPDGGVVTYQDLETEVGRWASGLWHSGVRRGDRVVYQVQKSPAVLALHLALLRCGAVQVPLNPTYSDSEVTALLAHAQPTIVVRDPAMRALAGPWASLTLDAAGDGTARDLQTDASANLPRIRVDDGAALLYTSGTTGRPKGALADARQPCSTMRRSLVELWAFTEQDVLLHVLPLFHTHGLFVAAHCVLASGGSMVLLPAFDVGDALASLPRCTV